MPSKKSEIPSPDDQPVNEKLADELRPLLHRLTRNLRRESVAAGFSSVDVAVLGLVKRMPGIGVSELATIEDTTRASMSVHVKRLSEAGWLAVDPSHGEDQRRSHLVLTQLGDEALSRIRDSSNRWLTRQLDNLGIAERKALARAIPALRALLAGPRDS
jgi:DNA-binding MarR family transcriptional regulator